MKLIKLMGIGLCACLLSACSTTRPTCAVGSDSGCKSVMEVNTSINQGYGSDAKIASSSKAEKLTLAPMNNYEDFTPERTQEQWVKVWVPARIDDADNYHPATEYYTVIKAAAWQEPHID